LLFVAVTILSLVHLLAAGFIYILKGKWHLSDANRKGIGRIDPA